MTQKTTNIHIHIFNGKCAPDYFFKMVLPPYLDKYADEIKAFLERRSIRWFIRLLSRRNGNSHFQKYLNFIETGTQNSQQDVFHKAMESYNSFGSDMRFVALTLNLDYMDEEESGHARIEEQLKEVEKVRSYYPNHLFPFVSVDPRHKTGTDLLQWVSEKIERRVFFGIKLYPAMGYFPFHPGLDELYKWAEANEIPVMTHCTREGNYYTGKMMNVIPQNNPVSLYPQSTAMDSIYKRIERFMTKPFTRDNSKYGCNVFSNPENYIPILEKYPKLKLCFAHFGGEDEVLAKEIPELVKREIDDLPYWGQRIIDIMNRFANVYTDISYTLAKEEALDKIIPYLNQPIGDRILFGTDFYMTVRTIPEDTLFQKSLNKLKISGFNQIAGINNDNYLRTGFYDPAIPFI
jgi:uncharacterized protein